MVNKLAILIIVCPTNSADSKYKTKIPKKKKITNMSDRNISQQQRSFFSIASTPTTNSNRTVVEHKMRMTSGIYDLLPLMRSLIPSSQATTEIEHRVLLILSPMAKILKALNDEFNETLEKYTLTKRANINYLNEFYKNINLVSSTLQEAVEMDFSGLNTSSGSQYFEFEDLNDHLVNFCELVDERITEYYSCEIFSVRVFYETENKSSGKMFSDVTKYARRCAVLYKLSNTETVESLSKSEIEDAGMFAQGHLKILSNLDKSGKYIVYQEGDVVKFQSKFSSFFKKKVRKTLDKAIRKSISSVEEMMEQCIELFPGKLEEEFQPGFGQ
eukprot:snap_masked-scaffold_9-processed-gene-13.26-mRNA-1 protein AED:1.00 eAED:1.00 QI:0/0/0/0/1/1/2/0/328